MAAFLGMRGTGDWGANQVPESWDEYILYEYPNGSAPLFAMQSMFGKKRVIDSYKHHWFTKTLPVQAGAVSGIYVNAGLTTSYSYTIHKNTYGVAGAVIYVKIAESLAKELKPTHKVLLRDSDQLDVDVVGKVEDVVYDGANSYVAVKLLEDDGNHIQLVGGEATSYNLSTVDRLLVSGNMNPEGSPAPPAIGYDPVEYTNVTGIYRNTLDITNTAIATTLRTGDAYKEEKRQCGELHSMEIEKDAFWSRYYEGVGKNGKPERSPMGLFEFVKSYAPDNYCDYVTDSDYTGKTWLQSGKKWLNAKLAQLARYMSYGSVTECVGFAGEGALLGIQELAEQDGTINLTPGQKDYGIEVITWRTVFLTVHLKIHPLFSHETTNSNLLVLGHPRNAKWLPLKGRDTTFETNMQLPGVDGKVDGYKTEGTWQWNFPNQWMVLRGVGMDNAL